ncbi:MAG: hypothetical protein K6E10_02535 [Eubacterium sp.]|nr:hypothetical protein [Eubacterium sp.]
MGKKNVTKSNNKKTSNKAINKTSNKAINKTSNKAINNTLNKALIEVLKEAGLFIILIMFFTLGLCGVAKISRDSLRPNFEKSAEFLNSGNVYPQIFEGLESSRLDRYADSILLGIAWQYDPDKPFLSTMQSLYFVNPKENVNANLAEAVSKDAPANVNYYRYWHGSILIVRPLLLILSLKGIYILNCILLVLLLALLIVILVKKHMYFPVVGLILGLILTSAWYVPFCLEYTWTFLLMTIFSLITIWAVSHKKENIYGCLFLGFGMITSFFDFLTTETLTLTLPLLLFVRLEADNVEFINAYERHKQQKAMDKKSLVTAFRLSITWLIGYAASWATKWLLTSIALGKNILPYISGNISNRLGGEEWVDLPLGQFLIGALSRNISCLLPLDFGKVGIIIGFVIFIIYLYFVYVYGKKPGNRSRFLIYCLVSIIPFLRFLLLHNHSYLHCFFTFRAQLATILGLVLIAEELGLRLPWGKESRREGNK